MGTSAIFNEGNGDAAMNLYNFKSSKLIMSDTRSASGYQTFAWHYNPANDNMGIFVHGEKAPMGWSDGSVSSMDARAVATEFKDNGGGNVFNYWKDGVKSSITIN